MKVKSCSECRHLCHLSKDETDIFEGLPIGYNKLCKTSGWQFMREKQANESVHEKCKLLGYSELNTFADIFTYIGGDGNLNYNFSKDKLKKFINYVITNNKTNEP
jgi:hypothetical protein